MKNHGMLNSHSEFRPRCLLWLSSLLRLNSSPLKSGLPCVLLDLLPCFASLQPEEMMLDTQRLEFVEVVGDWPSLVGFEVVEQV